MGIEVTALASTSGPLTKRISLSDDGGLISDGSACVMSRGLASRVRLESVSAFATMIGNLKSNEAVALGALRSELPDKVEIMTAKRLSELNGSAPPDAISRTAGHIGYAPHTPALALLDYDTKAMPPAVADRLAAHGGFWQALVAVAPALADAARVVRRSTSSGILRSDTGQPMRGSDGLHVFVHVRDGADIERFLKTLHDRCWLHGLGWMMVGAGGQFLDRSIVDRMVFAAERIVFEGAPILLPPLTQDAGLRAPVASEGVQVDTVAACRPLTIVEQSSLRDLKAADRTRLGGAAAASRSAFVEVKAAQIVERTGIAPGAARRVVEQQCGGVLLPAVVLPWDADDLAGAAVGDVLADPARFVGATLADPLEGVDYGRCKAKVMQRPDGSLWINSFAHGRTAYELRYDAAAVEAAVMAAEPPEAAEVFVRLLLLADMPPDEEQRLRDLAAQRAGVKARPMAQKVKQARAEHKKEQGQAKRDQAAASRSDRRIRLAAPLPDAERLPVMRMLDEVLSAVDQDEPPMRDLDGFPVEVRTRPPMMLHELTSSGSNQAETAGTRLPPPVLPLLSRHDRFSLAHEVENHIEFTHETEAGGIRSVALPGAFIDHFSAYRDSVLPRVGAVVTAPLVMPNGDLLAPRGLDRDRKLVFRIEPRLMAAMPAAQYCTRQDAAKAMDFLANRWLCDVATDFEGKCTLIALALTILERVLLPERPAFFITAGKRGGGKTTATMMVILAVTGKKPAAAAWSPNDEERRKAILAYLSEGLAALVWDNLALGTAVSCPTIEKVLTAESYSDRILGQSVNISVPAFTIMIFTGNNVGPKGDMASRSLMTRLEVDRPDPENRDFYHADPVGWTLENRGSILAALYTLLLSNPQLQPPKAAPLKTRFKSWWHLVGSAVENGAAALMEQQAALPIAGRNATAIDYGKIFAAVEADDEEGSILADTLAVLRQRFGAEAFQASQVASLANDPMDGEGEEAVVLRGFFDAGGRRGASNVTPIIVGRRLSAVVGAPVMVGNQVMRLDRTAPSKPGSRKTVSFFRVRVV